MGIRRTSLAVTLASVSVAATLGGAVALSHPVGTASPAAAVYGWGANSFGQLGNGSTTDSDVPVAVTLPGGSTATSLAVGAYHSLAVTDGGGVEAWGQNLLGQLGNGSTTNSDTPVAVKLPAGVTATAVAAGAAHSLALTSNGTTHGTVYAWGSNGDGELGDGSITSSDTPVVTKLPDGVTATAVAAGASHSLALASTGAVYAWGANYAGQLGNNSTTATDVPVLVKLPTGTTATAIAAGVDFSVALTNTGVYAWGAGFSGQLGNGSTAESNVPVLVKLPTDVTAKAIAAGAYHALVSTSTGAVYAWGANGFGQLGNGNETQSTVPVLANLPSGVTVSAVGAGASHSVAIGSDDSVYTWGDNTYGQLGNGSTTGSDVPVVAHLPTGSVSVIGTGGEADHTLAFTTLAGVPTVTGLSPDQGTTAGGTSVTITGTAFTGAKAVDFGSTKATSFTVNSPTKITAVAPAGSAGAVDVTVTTPGGTSAKSPADVYTYVTAAPGNPYHPLTPFRLLDTRTTTGGHHSPLGPGAALNLKVTGVDAIPGTATAVVLNVTATDPTQPSFLTVYPAGVTRPTASNLNFLPNQTVPNLVEVGIGQTGSTAGDVTIYNDKGATNVVADVEGYYGPSGRDAALQPALPGADPRHAQRDGGDHRSGAPGHAHRGAGGRQGRRAGRGDRGRAQRDRGPGHRQLVPHGLPGRGRRAQRLEPQLRGRTRPCPTGSSCPSAQWARTSQDPDRQRRGRDPGGRRRRGLLHRRFG